MTYQNTFAALADPSRRALFERLSKSPAHAGMLVSEFPLSQPAVSQHLKVLREAGLISLQREGRRSLYAAVPAALDELGDYLDGLRGVSGADGADTTVPGSAAELPEDAIAQAARQWGMAWPEQDANIYELTMRLLLMGRHVDRALKETAERQGLQGSELLLLDVLKLTPGNTLSPSQLQARLGVTKGAVTKLVSSLEAQGLIARSSSASDRRMSHVSLTRKAHDSLANTLSHHEYGADYAAAKKMPASQLAQLVGLLQRYYALLEQELLQRSGRKNVPKQ